MYAKPVVISSFKNVVPRNDIDSIGYNTTWSRCNQVEPQE